MGPRALRTKPSTALCRALGSEDLAKATWYDRCNAFREVNRATRPGWVTLGHVGSRWVTLGHVGSMFRAQQSASVMFQDAPGCSMRVWGKIDELYKLLRLFL